MTVQDLIDELQEYPKDTEVEVTLENFYGYFSADVQYTDIGEFLGKKRVTIYGKKE